MVAGCTVAPAAEAVSRVCVVLTKILQAYNYHRITCHAPRVFFPCEYTRFLRSARRVFPQKVIFGKVMIENVPEIFSKNSAGELANNFRFFNLPVSWCIFSAFKLTGISPIGITYCTGTRQQAVGAEPGHQK